MPMKDSKEVAIVIVAILVLAFFFFYIFQPGSDISEDAMEDAKDACLVLCKTIKNSKSEGPCLSNNIAPNWVCDVAHNPRQPVDDLPENQCLSYSTGKAKHFIEVTPECTFIRAG